MYPVISGRPVTTAFATSFLRILSDASPSGTINNPFGANMFSLFANKSQRHIQSKEKRVCSPLRFPENPVLHHFFFYCEKQRDVHTAFMEPYRVALLNIFLRRDSALMFFCLGAKSRISWWIGSKRFPNHACALPAETNLSVSRISEVLNYDEIKYFPSGFKKIIGVSPSTYRKQYSIHE